jgi:hypothetical protein
VHKPNIAFSEMLPTEDNKGIKVFMTIRFELSRLDSSQLE